MDTFKKVARVAVPLALMVAPFIVAAALPAPVPPVPGPGAISLTELEGYVQRIAQILISLSLVIAVIMIIYGGIRLMLAHGDEAAKTAKTVIWNGIKGAAIILAIGLILQTIIALVTRQFFR